MPADTENEPLPEQIRNLLYTEYLQYRRAPDEEEYRNSSSSRGKHQVARHPRSGRSTDTTGSEERTRDVVDTRIRFLKRLHNGFPTFDDASPDAGCGFEAWEFQGTANPVFYDKYKGLSVDMAAQYEPDNPRISILTEEAREAHWKLTAHKGFATLKGIPELQQLLAYTAADVVHYAVDNDELGKPGSWQPPVKHLREGEGHIQSVTESQLLADGSSLIGQLCPALRLCLAAEVATGLMCDSHAPPPDTPEHASALLLFLAAAIRRASQECQSAELWPAGGSWRLNPSIENCDNLIDFLACPSLEALQKSIRLCSRPAFGSSGSGSNSGSSTADGIWQQLQQPAGSGSVFCAALQLADALHTAREAAAEQSAAEQPAPASEQRGMVAELLQHTVDLMQAFFAALPQDDATRAAAPSAGPAGLQAVAAAAADAELCSRNGANSSSSCSNTNQLPGNASTPPTAGQVSWCVAVVAGAAALTALLSAHSACTQEAPQAEQLQQGVTVSLALLATEMQALHDSVADALQEAAASCGQQQQPGLDARPQRQQKLACSTPAVSSGSASSLHARVKQDTVMQMLQLSSTANNLAQVLSDCADVCSSSSRDADTTAPQQLVHAADVAAIAGAAGAAAVLGSPEKRSIYTGLTDKQNLQLLSNLVSTGMSPDVWCQQVFNALEQQQLSPLCLHPLEAGQASAQEQQQRQEQQQTLQAAAAAAHAAWRPVNLFAASAAEAAVVHAYSGRGNGLNASRQRRQQWAEHVSNTFHVWLSQQLQQHSSCAGPDSSSSTSSSSSALDGCFDEQPLQQVISSSGHLEQFASLAEPVLQFQQFWARAAQGLYFDATCDEWSWEELRVSRMASTAALREKAKKRAQNDLKQQQQAGRGKAKQKAGNKAKGGGSDVKGTDDGAAAAAAAAAAGANHTEQGSKDSDSSDSDTDRIKAALEEAASEPARCPLCEVEGPSDVAATYGRSSSSQGSSGLYSRFPVSWSDPCMMRRLLWDLLGKLKPTAQDWFKKHANMCPHRTWALGWHMVGTSLARHIWGPPGAWDAAAAEQMALLLPVQIRLYDKHVVVSPEEDLARCSYAHGLNAAFTQQGADGQVAALLSLQALLALDPHGARVQPHPELLYYIPSGFHAAVCKTLMQALQPVQRPPAVQPSAQPSASSTAAASSRPSGRVWQPPLQQQQQQQPEQQQHDVGQMHPLQSWSQAAFPAWYMWWHMGLLAYGQHKQQQELRGSSAAGSSSSSAAVTPLQELYNDVEARLYAVGYAARQLRTSDQLLRLLSNPPVAAGLSIAPADWVAAGPSHVQCGYCDKVTPTQQAGPGLLCCCVCWTWYCNRTCYSQRCPSHCHSDPLIQAKASRAWRVLDLLKPSLVPYGPQQPPPQQQQRELPASPAAAAAVGLHGLPQASQNMLPSIFKSLLRAHHTSQQQVLDQGQHWRARQQQSLADAALMQLYEPPPWGMTCGVPRHSKAGADMLAATAKLAHGLRVEEPVKRINWAAEVEDALSNITELISVRQGNIRDVARRLDKFNTEQQTPRQRRHQLQRQRHEMRDWDRCVAASEQRRGLQRPPGLGLRQGLQRRYGPWPPAVHAAAAGDDDGALLSTSSNSSGISLGDELDLHSAAEHTWGAALPSQRAARAAAAGSDAADRLAAVASSLQRAHDALRGAKDEEQEDFFDVLRASGAEPHLLGSVTEADGICGALPGTPVATDQVGSGSMQGTWGCNSGSTSADEGESAAQLVQPSMSEWVDEFDDDRYGGLD